MSQPTAGRSMHAAPNNHSVIGRGQPADSTSPATIPAAATTAIRAASARARAVEVMEGRVTYGRAAVHEVVRTVRAVRRTPEDGGPPDGAVP